MPTDHLRFFIGWDSCEPIAFHTFAHSLIRRSTVPLTISPLVQGVLRLRGLYTRQRRPSESTEFSLTRFLVPALCDYQGFAIFADSDMLALDNPAPLLKIQEEMAARKLAVGCCQHYYTPSTETKMDGQIQTVYPRKNWSSFLIFNTPLCRALSPEYVNRASGLELHRLQWTMDSQLFALPLEWNWLVGEYGHGRDVKIVHYTLGGPWFRDHQNCDYADQWREECREAELPPSGWGREAWNKMTGRFAESEAP